MNHLASKRIACHRFALYEQVIHRTFPMRSAGLEAAHVHDLSDRYRHQPGPSHARADAPPDHSGHTPT
jgi:hypothetical protein